MGGTFAVLAAHRVQRSQPGESVEVGQLAPIKVLSAQAEVATREADILQTEAQVKNNEDRLKMILNLSTAALDRALGLSLKNKDMKISDFARTN